MTAALRFVKDGKADKRMKGKHVRVAFWIGMALTCLIVVQGLTNLLKPVGNECFAFTVNAEKAGYYTLLIDGEQTAAQENTLSVFINGVFSRKAVFSGETQKTASVPVYLKMGANNISFRAIQGDREMNIAQIRVEQRAFSTKMVLAPHEDDEVLAFAGSIMHMLENGDDVVVVLVTNGDWKGKEIGMERLLESARALAVLGVPRENLIIMGYPDAELDQLLAAGSSRKVLELEYGEEYTYGNYENQLYDFHTLQHAQAAAMTGYNIRKDLLDILSVHMPSEIYLPSEYDLHSDHASTNTLTMEALKKLWQEDGYNPRVYETIIHGYDDQLWPERLVRDENGEAVIRPFTNPFPQGEISLAWEDAVHIQLTPEMISRKKEAISMYYTQNVIMGWADQNDAYLKSDEFFWIKDALFLLNDPQAADQKTVSAFRLSK